MKRLTDSLRGSLITWLKPGVNEKVAVHPVKTSENEKVAVHPVETSENEKAAVYPVETR